MRSSPAPPTCRPIPEAEAPRDCPLCPRLVRFVRSAAPSIPAGGTRRCRRSAIARPGWRSSALRPASTAPTAPAGRSPAIMPASCSTRRCSSSGWPRANMAPTRRRAAASRARSSSMRSNACRRRTSPSRARSRPAAIISKRRWQRCRGARRRRAGPDRACRGCAGAGPAAVVDEVRPWRREHRAGRPHPAVELSLLALQPEYRPARRGDVRERVRAGARAQMSSVSRP